MAVRCADALVGLAWAELATKHLEAAVVTAHLVVQRYEGSAMPWARHARREMARVIGAAVALLVESVLYPSELVDSAALARQALSRVGDAEAEALGMEVWTTLCRGRGQCRAESMRTGRTPERVRHVLPKDHPVLDAGLDEHHVGLAREPAVPPARDPAVPCGAAGGHGAVPAPHLRAEEVACDGFFPRRVGIGLHATLGPHQVRVRVKPAVHERHHDAAPLVP